VDGGVHVTARLCAIGCNKKVKDLEITAEMVKKRDLSVTLLEKAG